MENDFRSQQHSHFVRAAWINSFSAHSINGRWNINMNSKKKKKICFKLLQHNLFLPARPVVPRQSKLVPLSTPRVSNNTKSTDRRICLARWNNNSKKISNHLSRKGLFFLGDFFFFLFPFKEFPYLLCSTTPHFHFLASPFAREVSLAKLCTIYDRLNKFCFPLLITNSLSKPFFLCMLWSFKLYALCFRPSLFITCHGGTPGSQI